MSCKNKWSNKDAENMIRKYNLKGISEDLALRTYSARLLGSDPELVLHGGGNTSVKSFTKDLLNNLIPVLHVKGSGWDLGTIEPEGHPAVKLNPLLELKKLNELNDENMVAVQRQNLLNPKSPNPSVETLLHAFIPNKFIDHTHSLALLAIANQPNAEELCKEIYGNKVAIVPYVMPGFDLAIEANKAYEQANIKAKKEGIELEGMVLINHGLFSFGDTAKLSYERMINLVNIAEENLKRKINLDFTKNYSENNISIKILPYLRGLIARISKKYCKNNKWIFDIRNNASTYELFQKSNLTELIKLGVATPDHVIRTKAKPLLIEPYTPKQDASNKEIKSWLEKTEIQIRKYIKEYEDYFIRNATLSNDNKKQLDPIPRLILIPYIGLIGLGFDKKSAIIAADIGQAWIETVLSADSIGSFAPVGEKDTFDLEYWSLEQAKLGANKDPLLKGNIVVITGAGGAIGSQIAKEFKKAGAEIIAIDLDKDSVKITSNSCGINSLGICCDITKPFELEKAFEEVIKNFGGLDILISNAGAAWEGSIANMHEAIFRKSMELNLFAHYYVSKSALEIFHAQDCFENNKDLFLGGQILFNISKQALNPGPNFGSYGISKAALLALMKQISLEEGINKIRANGINADRIKSGLLNQEMIKKRALSRGISEKEYMEGNLLNSEVNATDVAKAFLALADMKKTTGALLTVDGGNVAAMVR
tara:strand:+ start:17400 stop:19526 length:2127 start_codon:yes stop_codon:yes gene_type:complete